MYTGMCLNVWDDMSVWMRYANVPNLCKRCALPTEPPGTPDMYLNVKSVPHKKWGRGATDTCRSSSLWPNEVRRTRWTRIWPDSIIYTHALYSELFNDWKVLFDLYKQTASWAPPLTGPPLLWTFHKFNFDFQTKSTIKPHKKKNLQTYCTMYSVESGG